MTPKRPQRLNWVGNVLPDGRPERFLEFMPVDENGTPRNLTAEETDALTQDQLHTIRQHPDLYHEVSAPAPKAKASRTQPEAAGAAVEAEPAAEPATESEG